LIVDIRPNVLFITLDQFRADSMSCAGHPLVRTPNLDVLAGEGVRFARHYAQSAPCAPGRAALYTGTYQMNNRVVANGTPLDHRFDNVARAGRRAGYEPALFGYTDQGVDPRTVGRDDPQLWNWEGVLPGFDCIVNLDERHEPWLQWLQQLGYEANDPDIALATEPLRSAEHSLSTFMTDRLIEWLDSGDVGGEPWFVHASYLRPHPPYAAAGHFSTMYDPDDCPLPLPRTGHRPPLYDAMLAHPLAAVPQDGAIVAAGQAQYFGMISEVDAQLGRLWSWLRQHDMWDRTVVVVTSDHGEQLGDQGLVGKLGYFESSYHIPCIIRDPRQVGSAGAVVEEFTENVDIFPTICEAIGVAVPVQCDGLPLTPFLRGEQPPAVWRQAACYEWDWRDQMIPDGDHHWPWDRRLERQHLTVRRSRDHAYVQFGDGSWRCFDLAADPTWSTEVSDPQVVLAHAQQMLVWRSCHADRTLTDMLLRDGGIGRWPDPAATEHIGRR
jgi:arylsulfatase A-like enzyme